MKHTLNYGRITWSYDDFDPTVPCRPNPLVTFSPVKINGKLKHPIFTDKVGLQLLTLKEGKVRSYREAYAEWFSDHYMSDRDLSEGRAFLKWLKSSKQRIEWRPENFHVHEYFQQKNAPKHDPTDEMAQNLSFAIAPVVVEKRKVKLYLEDESVLNLLSLPYGEDRDFLSMVKDYIKSRFQYELWRAPAPPFLDWVKNQGIRPVFSVGQLGLCLSNDKE